MKIVIAPDSFKESLSAMEVADAIEAGFKQVLPDATYVKLPMADGGEGTVRSLVDATDGRIVTAEVTAPLGNKVEGFLGLLGDGKRAVIEMAAASGLHLVAPEQRNPLLTSSVGTGELILAALDLGVTHLILGIGGSATNDGGAGMIQALGGKLLKADGSAIGFGGAALAELATIDLSGLDARLADLTIEVACDVNNPLCGPKGASAVFGPQKGANYEMVVQLDNNLSHYADCIEAALGCQVKDIPGAGAAGGMGAALVGLLGAELKPGIQIVIEALDLASVLQDADLVITGEGRIDSQTIHGKTPMGVARCAKQFGKPVIGIAGCLTDDCGVVHEHGIDAVFAVVNRAMSLPEALETASTNLMLTSRNVAALYQLKL
ncbi:glycerate kinase [Aeromonas sp. BIGb0405]|jgi:glycerate 2-kinase|uniref:glycerate kinase n=1 Tax=unclassified Aeromonas TaxID=257493 RepID=UPI002166E529|nr:MULTISPECIES: glycerate kinase [unclassified Aeromonas]MCS3456618.1 glycerate kinase [Aeromonas sp. BIGb0405]MCS3460573.1 glycerate kinase [Aeromonas sp. BIGb0445]